MPDPIYFQGLHIYFIIMKKELSIIITTAELWNELRYSTKAPNVSAFWIVWLSLSKQELMEKNGKNILRLF